MRYFLKLSYNGAPYNGWQIQPQGTTVQGVIEQAISTLLRQPTGVTGAGRTDTGVNAREMYAHFDTDRPLPETFLRSLNSLVGKDISIQAVIPVADDAHARFNATERTYRYFVTVGKSPFLYPHAWQAPSGLDFEKMNEAARYIVGRRDFTSFSKLHTQVKTNICDVRCAAWHKVDDTIGLGCELWYFEISADRFLRNMVRAIVGTLVDVGRGKIQPGAVADIIAKKDRCSAGTSMPGNALYLWSVDYEH